MLAAVGWEVLHLVAGVYARHVLKGMSQTYGMFAIVLGALGWIFLQARVVVYAAEVNVVRHDRLWPRSLQAEPGGAAGTGADGAMSAERRVGPVDRPVADPVTAD